MSHEHSTTAPEDHHIAVLKALHKYERAWAAYEWHFRQNDDPNCKEQSTMAQMRRVQKELAALGVVIDDTGELNYPLSKAELVALSETRRIERERWQAQELAPVIAEEYQEWLAIGRNKEAITRCLLNSISDQACNGRLQLPPEQARAFAAKLVQHVIKTISGTEMASQHAA